MSRLCRPWDLGDFQRRLCTFKISTWTAVPGHTADTRWLIPSPVDCARHGWTNIGRNQLQCETCMAQLDWKESISNVLSMSLDHDVSEASQELHQLLSRGHGANCSWIKLKCDESINQFTVRRWPSAKKHLLEMLNEGMELKEHFDCLPSLEELLNGLFSSHPRLKPIINTDNLSQLKQSLELSQDFTHDSILLCVLFGWKLMAKSSDKSPSHVLKCSFCYREVPLTAGPDHPLRRLNILDQHALYCPLRRQDGAWTEIMKMVPGMTVQEPSPQSPVES